MEQRLLSDTQIPYEKFATGSLVSSSSSTKCSQNYSLLIGSYTKLNVASLITFFSKKKATELLKH